MSRSMAVVSALVSVFALGATASAASAAKLTLSQGGVALAPGQAVFAEDGQIQVNTSDGPLECPFGALEANLELSVVTNSRGKDELEVNRFHERELGSCRSFTGNSEARLGSVGSFLKLDADGTALTGLYPTLTLLFEHEEYAGLRYTDIECTYRRERLRGTNTATPALQRLQIDVGGKLTLHLPLSSPKARRLCPSDAEVSVSFPFIEGETGELIEEQTSP